MAMSKIDRIDREIEKTRGKITEYQNRLKELEAQRTEQENFEIVNLVRSMCMSRDELMNFLARRRQRRAARGNRLSRTGGCDR